LRNLRRLLAACGIVASAAASALAHGGGYDEPGGAGDPGPPLGPPWHPPHVVEPPATPGDNDPKVAVTRWETWWSANKDAYLRFPERLAADAPNATPDKAPPSEREKLAAQKRADALRKRLADLFIDALGDAQFEVRTAAAIALGKTGEASGSGPLREAALKDSNKDVRDSAVIGLGLSGRATEIPFLEKMLFDRDENPRRRAFAAFAMGLIGGDDAAVPLLRFVVENGDASGGDVLRKKPEMAASIYAAMGLTGSADVLPVLRAAAIDPKIDPGVRGFAFVSLGRMKDHASLAMLQTTLVSDRDPTLRRAAAIALGRAATTNDAGAVGALVSAMQSDKDPMTKHFATTSLGALPCPESRDALRAELARSSAADAAFVAIALALQKDADSVPTIRKMLLAATPVDESAAGSCCVALGLLGDVQSAAAIEKAFDGAKRIGLQGYAAISLGLIGATGAIDGLKKRLEVEKDPRLRVNLAISLGLLRDPRAKTYLVETVRKAETFYEKSSAALALGALRCTSAVGDLEVVYRDAKEKEILRAFAVVALGEIADPSPVSKLTRFSVDGNYDAAQRVDPLRELLTIY